MTKSVAQSKPAGREEAIEALLDAAERLLVRDGYADITTRKVAGEAGVNHGLVHYYFGSMEELFLQVLERFTAGLVTRQRAMYGEPVPFIEKWRAAMRYLDDDISAGYAKVWAELQAMSWNRPHMRKRMQQVDSKWRATLTDAFGEALDEYGLSRERFPLDAVVSLVITFNKGIEMEQLQGITTGHRELLDWIDGWLQSLEDGSGR